MTIVKSLTTIEQSLVSIEQLFVTIVKSSTTIEQLLLSIERLTVMIERSVVSNVQLDVNKKAFLQEFAGRRCYKQQNKTDYLIRSLID